MRRVGKLVLRLLHEALQRDVVGLLVQHPDDHVALEEPLFTAVHVTLADPLAQNELA